MKSGGEGVEEEGEGEGEKWGEIRIWITWTIDFENHLLVAKKKIY